MVVIAAAFVGVDAAVGIDADGDDHAPLGVEAWIVVGKPDAGHLADQDAVLADRRFGGHAGRFGK